MTASNNRLNHENVPLAKILVAKRRRNTTQAKVKALADSIREIGLLVPIGLTKDYHLIYGCHRLEAIRLLGDDTISARIHDLDELHAELAEIDENLLRSELSAVQEAKALKRRKEIYLGLHPETKPGGSPGKAGGGKKAKMGNMPGFAEDTAQKTGKSRSTIDRSVKLAEEITDAAAIQLDGTKVANNKTELKRLAALSEDNQLVVANAIRDGKAKTVTEAMKLDGIKAPAKEETEHTEDYYAREQVKVWCDAIGRWLGGKPSIDEYRGKWPGNHGDQAVKAATDLYESLKRWHKAIK